MAAAKKRPSKAEAGPVETIDIARLLPRPEDEIPDDLSLVDPRTGKPTGIVLQVVGSDARAYRTQVGRLLRSEGITDLSDDGMTDDQIQERNERMGRVYAAASIVGWTGAAWDQKEFPWSLDNAMRLMTAVPWIGDAVLAKVQSKKKGPTGD